MEHEWIMVKTKQVPGIGGSLNFKDGVEIARWGWGGGCDPLSDCAVVDNTLFELAVAKVRFEIY